MPALLPLSAATLAPNDPARQASPPATTVRYREEGADPAPVAPSVGGWLALAVKIALGAFGIGLALALAMIGLVLIASPAQAASDPDGAMLLLERCGRQVPAPLLSSEASLTVTGPVLRGRVTQRFVNEVEAVDGTAAASCESVFIEASYLFPLADGAAVDHLRLVVGERVIEGQIRERQAAVRAHEAARAEGRRSALLESRRPNAFSTRVANIAPGETVTIEIEYQQTLAPSDDVWQLRFPTVVAPRYSRDPDGGDLAQPYVVAANGAGGAGGDTMDLILDETWEDWYRSKAAEPSFDDGPHPAESVEPAAGRFSLTVSLDAGVPILPPRSLSHRITAEAPANGGSPAWRIAVDEAGPGDRDFVLEWQARASPVPRAGLRVETHDGQTYGLLVVDPPRGEDSDRIRLPRETTFVIDTSGSMGGQSIEQARSALLFALDRLMPGDAFNLIQFNSQHSALFEAPVTVDARTLAQARRWIRGLHAQGGTEMGGAVAEALTQPLTEGRLGQVIFITDGAVDYEEELVRQIGDLIGERRLFTVAIGSAPNSWFLRKAAEIGGGTLTRIGSVDEVERRMAALFTRLARPASTDLALEVDGAELLQDPQLPRDLYAGDPLVAVLRLSGEPARVRLKGRHQAPWQMAVDIARADARGAGLHALWARQEIEAIDDQLQRGARDEASRRQLRESATRLALAHHLVSRHTSLVAIDERVARTPGSPLVGVATPAAMPAGWTLARTATPAGLQLLLGSLLLVAGFALLVQRRVCAWLATVFGGRR